MSNFVTLTWTKNAGGYVAISTTGLYEARRGKNGKFILYVEHEAISGVATTLTDCKERAETLHSDRYSRVKVRAAQSKFQE